MVNWQTAITALIVLAAVAYVARRIWQRLRSFSAKRNEAAACGSGCGKCPDVKTESAPRATLVTLTRSKSSGNR